MKFSDSKIRVYLYSDRGQIINCVNHGFPLGNIIDLSFIPEKSGLEIIYKAILKKGSTNNIEKMCNEIDDYDLELTNDIVLIFKGFDTYTSDQVSDFVQTCHEWSERLEHIKMILLIPKEKCILRFQDASKISIGYL